MHICILLLTALVSESASARGWHSNDHGPDWLNGWLIGAALIFLFATTAGAAFRYWKKGNYLHSVISSAICAGLSWLLLRWIDWDSVLALIATIGTLGGLLIVLGASLFIIGFALKHILGIFVKDEKSMSGESIVNGFASSLGFIAVLVVQFLVFATMFIGLPVMIVIKIFGLS